jgi:hypothetical protein
LTPVCAFFCDKQKGQHQWRHVQTNTYNLKLPTKDASRMDFASAAVDDEVYVFGGKLPTSMDPTLSCCKFSFTTQTWTELPDLPTPFVNCGVTRGRLALDALGCHLECPHCIFRPLKDRTTYNVPFNFRERAESPARFYDMDDSDNTDNEDYYYDDVEPSFSDDGWGPYLDPDEYDLYDIF